MKSGQAKGRKVEPWAQLPTVNPPRLKTLRVCLNTVKDAVLKLHFPFLRKKILTAALENSTLLISPFSGLSRPCLHISPELGRKELLRKPLVLESVLPLGWFNVN